MTDLRLVGAAMLILAFACKETPQADPGYQPVDDTVDPSKLACTDDDDCLLFEDACCDMCGLIPPYTTFNRETAEPLRAAKRLRCLFTDCGYITCNAPPPCRPSATAACEAGQCTPKVQMEGECGPAQCDFDACGAQPPTDDGSCSFQWERRWALCCCRSMGNVGCDGEFACDCEAPSEFAQAHPGFAAVCNGDEVAPPPPSASDHEHSAQLPAVIDATDPDSRDDPAVLRALLQPGVSDGMAGPRPHPWFRPQWLECSDASDCTIEWSPCSLTYAVVAKDHALQAREELETMCDGFPEISFFGRPPKVTCHEKKCVEASSVPSPAP